MKRMLSLLILIPGIALAEVCSVPIACDKRINSHILGLELGVPFQVFDCIGDLALNGVIQPGTARPARIDAEAADCSALATLIASHNPAETEAEEHIRLLKEAKELEIKLSDAYKELFDKVKKLEDKAK